MSGYSNADTLSSIVVVFLVVGAMAVFHFGSIERSRAMLARWARENGWESVSAKFLWLGGPYWWRRGRDQYAFAVHARGVDGTYRHGFALCGHWLLGLSVDRVEVEWREFSPRT